MRGEGRWRFYKGCGNGEIRCDNPSGSRPNFFGRQHLTFDKGDKDVVRGEGIVRKISLMVRIGSNPHHSWLGLTEQQNLTLFRGRAWMPEVERPEFRKDAKPTERSFKGKGVGVGRGDSVLLRGLWG